MTDSIPTENDDAEQAVRLRAVLDAAVDGIVTIDGRGTIESVNRAAVKMFAYSAEEMVGQNVSMLMPSPFREEHNGYLANYQQTRVPKIIGIGREVVGQRKDGSTFPMNLAVGEVKLKDRRLFTGIIRDLTSEKAVEAELAEREEQIRFMVENLPAGAVYVDLIEGTLFCNRAVEEMTGYSADQLRTLEDAFLLLFDADADEARTQYEEGVAHGDTDQRIAKVIHADGSHLLFEFTRYRYDHHEVWLVHDVTEQIEATESIKRERDFVRTLLDTTQAVVTVIGADGAIIRSNQAAERLLGLASGSICRQPWGNVFSDQKSGDCPIALRLINGESIESELSTAVTRRGDRREILWWGTPLEEAGPVDEVAVLVGHDVTDFRNAQKRALQAERLAAIGQMVAGLAHESRNALQRAQAGLDVLALDIPEDQRKLVDRVGAAITHVYRLYDEVRDYAAPVQLQLETASLQAVWERAWATASHSDDVSVSVVSNVADDVDVECEIDAYRMEQVFRNIFENAIAVSPPDGVVTVSLTAAPADAMKVSVCDRGPGLNDEQLEKLFDPFFTTKQRGTGLGMAIVSRIVDAHGGAIEAKNAPDGGAIIEIVLPRSQSVL